MLMTSINECVGRAVNCCWWNTCSECMYVCYLVLLTIVLYMCSIFCILHKDVHTLNRDYKHLSGSVLGSPC